MNIKEKLDSINSPSIIDTIGGLPISCDSTIETFFTNFIEPRLPQKQYIKKWHEVLMQMVANQQSLSCAVRYGNRGDLTPNLAGETGYEKLRRGWLTQDTKSAFNYFYADNYLTSFIYKMVLDGFVPSKEELESAFNAHVFPYGFGFHVDKTYEAECCVIPTGPEPGFLGNYKISHIFNSGEQYEVEGIQYKGIKELSEAFFDIGERSQWLKESDHIRKVDISPKEKEVITACFLRFIHPINYFLTPSKKRHICKSTVNIADIGEYPLMVQYMRNYIQTEYPNEYNEFVNKIMWYDVAPISVTGKEVINISYGISKNSTSSFTEDVQLEIANHFLSNKDSLIKTEEVVLGAYGKQGWTAKKILDSLGIQNSKKGILCQNSIDYEIKNSSGKYQETLLRVKAKYY